MEQITVPLLMVAGSHDIVAPVVTEQIHPYIWLQSEPKYLALLDVGTHFSSKPGRESAADTQDVADEAVNLLIGEHRDIGTRYTKILNIAFWKSTLQNQTAYLPYLTASYGIAASADQPLRLDLIQSLTSDQLEAAYGGPTPIPIVPPAITELPPPRAESILAEIERTGVLQVALRRDAAPFGFIDQDDAWDGYCGDLAVALGNYLTETLDMPFDIQVVELASTLDNRFDLVRDGTVHLECGPNTIRADIPGIDFSRQIFVTSAQFLTLQDQADTINPTASLAGSRLGVLASTTTETFVETTYPQAERILFTGAEAREEAVQAVVTGQIDAFVGDGILTYGEVMRQNLPLADLALRPDIPLTCEFYGLALPDNDPGWKTTVDQFLLSESTQEAFATWFADTLPSLLNDAEYCLNQ
jgi:ABC-type amino acid transport substrate-binding protein